MPAAGVPFIDPETGLISQAWFLFLQSVWQRTGAAPGTDAVATQNNVTGITAGAQTLQFADESPLATAARNTLAAVKTDTASLAALGAPADESPLAVATRNALAAAQSDIIALSMLADLTGTGLAARSAGVTGIANGGTGASTAAGALATLGAAPTASPTFSGTVTIPAGASISGYLTTTVAASTYAPISSVPTNSAAVPLADGTATAGTAGTYAREGHVHPTDTTRAPTASPSFTGVLSSAGQIAVGSNTATAAPVILNGAAGNKRRTVIQTAGVGAWEYGADASTQSGSNVGGDFYIQGHDDTGAALTIALNITRATGLTTVLVLKSAGGLSAFGVTPPTSRPAISGSRSSATATVLGSLLTALNATGLITDSTTA